MVSTHYGGEVELLRSHYKGLPNDESLVAFVDESYRLPGEAKPGESPFYTMTAVLLRRKDLLGTREDLTRIADGDYWHTVEFAQRAEGRDKIADMLDYLASYKDTCVISVHSSLGTEGDAKSMRQACLHTLVVALAGSGPDEGVTWSPVSMFVLERQRAIKDADRDLYTIKQARRRGLVPRNTIVKHASPAIEHLLWLPDMVSHTYRRYITHGDQQVLRLDDQTVTLEASGGTSDPLGAAAYHQGVSSQFP